MTQEITAVRAPKQFFRLGFGTDAWSWPPRQFIGSGRWDDPARDYRVLYASTSRLGTFVEVMGDFATDTQYETEWLLIDGDDEAATPPGQAPTDWLRQRVMGRARMEGLFAEVGTLSSLRYLNSRLRSVAVQCGVQTIDAAAIRARAPRALTQAISRLVRNSRTRQNVFSRSFRGIYYSSRHGDDFENWAIFEPCRIRRALNERVDETDPDFAAAVKQLGLARPR
jgi:RES domain